MNVPERLKILRKKLEISQEDFGKRLGVTKAAISRIERGDRNLTEQMALSVCREFKINYLWLTEGKGDMRTETQEEIFDEIKAEYDLTDDDVYIMKTYFELDKDQRKRLMSYIKAIVDTEKEKG